MVDSDILNGIILSTGRREYSFADLVYLSGPFGISETSIRSSMSRWVKKDFYQVRKEGRTAWYSLSERGKRIGRNLSRGFSRPDWSDWDGSWKGIIFSIPEEQRKERIRLVNKLTGYRFARWYGGFWIRPYDREEPFDGSASDQFRVIRFVPDPAITKEEVSGLWDLRRLAEEQNEALNSFSKGIDSLSSPEAFKYRIEQGNRIVPLLFKDPLLPPRILPANWPGTVLLERFLEQDKRLVELSRPFMDKVFD